jgi:hypothetical protein
MPKLTDLDVEALRIELRHRSVWWLVVLTALCFCFAWACNTYVKLRDDPPWLRFALTVLNTVIYAAGPYWLHRQSEKRMRSFIENYVTRLTRIEKLLDNERTSTGLRIDGTDPAPGEAP